MSQPDFVSRQQPTRTGVKIADLTMIVRPPGKPTAIRVFTAAEVAEADQYAAQFGATVESLPLPYP